MEFQTKLIHGNWKPDAQTGATNVPMYFSNAYAHTTAKELENIFAGRDMGYVYARISNPSVEAFENRIASLEGGIAAVAAASGMAAIYLALMNILKPGNHVVASAGLFGGTFNLLKNLKQQEINVTFLEEMNQESLKNAITDQTKIVFAETIGNPKLDVLDLEEIGKVCEEHRIIFMVDSTITTPYLVKPLEYGADIVIHSTSKYMNGTSNALGGVIIDGGSKKYENERYLDFKDFTKRYRRFAFTAKLRSGIGRDLGAILSPMSSFLHLTGLETLALRMREHCKNAITLAQYLESHPKIVSVQYPSLKSSKYYETAKKYYPDGASGILTCRLGSKEKAFALIDHVKLFANLANIGDTKSLILHPASTICIHNTLEEKEQMGVYEDLVRISVGIEDSKDIISDIEQALHKI